MLCGEEGKKHLCKEMVIGTAISITTIIMR